MICQETNINIVYINIFIAVRIKNESTEFHESLNWETKKIVVLEIRKKQHCVSEIS